MMLNADPSEEELETFFQALPDLPSAPPRTNTTPGPKPKVRVPCSWPGCLKTYSTKGNMKTHFKLNHNNHCHHHTEILVMQKQSIELPEVSVLVTCSC